MDHIFLMDTLGVTLTAVIAGCKDAREPAGWEDETHVPEYAIKRMQAARYAAETVGEVEGSDTVRAWFVGKNPLLGQSPAMALRAGRLDDVRQAADAMAAGTWSA